MARHFLLITVLCWAAVSEAQSSQPQPIDTDLCAVRADIKQFDKKLIRLHAFVRSGFEDSTLFDQKCPEEALGNWNFKDRPGWIWMSFGDEEEMKGSKVKGYEPLVEDDEYKGFHELLIKRRRQGQMSAATIVGTFYAETKSKSYGHMGCCSLFVVSRVEHYDRDYEPDLDYSNTRWNITFPPGCMSAQNTKLPTNAELRALQEKASASPNDGSAEDIHRDPAKVAEDYMRRILGGEIHAAGGRSEVLVRGKSDQNVPEDARPTRTPIEERSQSYIKSYVWLEPDRVVRILVNVSRPYWLKQYAKSAEDVIWVPTGAAVVRCGPRK